MTDDVESYTRADHHFLPLHRLMVFGIDRTVGDVLAELRRRRGRLVLIPEHDGFRIADVPQLLGAALQAADNQTSAVREVRLAAIAKSLPRLTEVTPRTARARALDSLTRIASHGFSLVRSHLGPLGLLTSLEGAVAFAGTAALYWECADGCAMPTKPRGDRCLPHGLPWQETS